MPKPKGRKSSGATRKSGNFLTRKDEAIQWFQRDGFVPAEFLHLLHSEKELDQARNDLTQLNEYCKQEVQKVVHDHHKDFLEASHGIQDLEASVDELRNYVSGSAAVVANLVDLPALPKQRSLASPSLGPLAPAADDSPGQPKAASVWDGVLAAQADLMQGLQVAVAERDYLMARALLSAGRDMVAVVERDAAQLGPQVGGEDIAAWRYGFEGSLASQKALMIEDLQRQLVQTGGSTVERRQVAQVLGLLLGPSQATQALLHCHTLRVRAAQQHLLKQHSAAGGDPDGVEYAGGLAQRTFLAIGAAVEDVRAVFPGPPVAANLSNTATTTSLGSSQAGGSVGAGAAAAASGGQAAAEAEDVSAVLPTVSALVVQWAGGEARHCAALLCRHALAPFAATGLAVGALLCVGLALVFCATLESSHGLALQVVFREELWPLVEAIVRRHLQRLKDDASSATSLDATNAALQAVAGASMPAASGQGLLPSLFPRPDLPAVPAAPAGLTALPALLPELRALAEGLAPLGSLQAVALLRQGVVAVFEAVCEKVHGSLSRLTASGGKDAGAYGAQLAAYVVRVERLLLLFAESDVQAALEPLAKVTGPVAPPELLAPALRPLNDLLALLPPPAPEAAAAVAEAQPQTALQPQSSGLLDRIRAELEAEQERREREREGWRGRDTQDTEAAAAATAGPSAAVSAAAAVPGAAAGAAGLSPAAATFASHSAVGISKPPVSAASSSRPVEPPSAVEAAGEALVSRRRRDVSAPRPGRQDLGALSRAAGPQVQPQLQPMEDSDSEEQEGGPVPLPARHRRQHRSSDRPAAGTLSEGEPGVPKSSTIASAMETMKPPSTSQRQREPAAEATRNAEVESAPRWRRVARAAGAVDEGSDEQEGPVLAVRPRRRRPDGDTASAGTVASAGVAAAVEAPAGSAGYAAEPVAGLQRRRDREAARGGGQDAAASGRRQLTEGSELPEGDDQQAGTERRHRRRAAAVSDPEGEPDDGHGPVVALGSGEPGRRRAGGAMGSAAGIGLPHDSSQEASVLPRSVPQSPLRPRGRVPGGRAWSPAEEGPAAGNGASSTTRGVGRSRAAGSESDDGAAAAAARHRHSSAEPRPRLRRPPRPDPEDVPGGSDDEGLASKTSLPSRKGVVQAAGDVRPLSRPRPRFPQALDPAEAVTVAVPAKAPEAAGRQLREAPKEEREWREDGQPGQSLPRPRRTVAWDAAPEDEGAASGRHPRERAGRPGAGAAEAAPAVESNDVGPARRPARAGLGWSAAETAPGTDESQQPARFRRRQQPDAQHAESDANQGASAAVFARQRSPSPVRERQLGAGKDTAAATGGDWLPAGPSASAGTSRIRARAAAARPSRDAATDDETGRVKDTGAGGARKSNRFGVMLSDDDEPGRVKDDGTARRTNRFGVVLSDDEDAAPLPLPRGPRRPHGGDATEGAVAGAGRSVPQSRDRAAAAKGPVEIADNPPSSRAATASAAALAAGAAAAAEYRPRSAAASKAAAADASVSGTGGPGLPDEGPNPGPGQVLTAKQRLAARMAAKAAQSAAKS